MSEMEAIFGEFLKIQMQQNKLLKEIAEKQNLQQFWQAAIQHGTHMRDHHNGFWDPQLSLEAQQKLNGEIDGLDRRYEQNQKRLEELRQQLFAEGLSS